MRKNTRGLFLEQWNHSVGCRQWFLVERNTITYEIISTKRINSDALNSEVPQ
jgi:sarcosine oxidase subunit delta